MIRKLAAALTLAGAITITPTPAHADNPASCHTADADPQLCRDAGWFIRPWVHVGPRGWVRYLAPRLEPCGEYVGDYHEIATATPPTINCWWDHNRRGNGEPGESYVVVDTRRSDYWLMIINGFRLGQDPGPAPTRLTTPPPEDDR